MADIHINFIFSFNILFFWLWKWQLIHFFEQCSQRHIIWDDASYLYLNISKYQSGGSAGRRCRKFWKRHFFKMELLSADCYPCHLYLALNCFRQARSRWAHRKKSYLVFCLLLDHALSQLLHLSFMVFYLPQNHRSLNGTY